MTGGIRLCGLSMGTTSKTGTTPQEHIFVADTDDAYTPADGLPQHDQREHYNG